MPVIEQMDLRDGPRGGGGSGGSGGGKNRGGGNRPEDGNATAVSLGAAAGDLIRRKHTQYVRASAVNRILYYCFRLVAALSACLLPFVVASSPVIATGLSITIVVSTAFDLVLNPKDKWKIYSRASDLLTVERLKQEGDYPRYEALVSVLLSTENALLERLVDIDQLLKQIKEVPPR